MPIFENSPLIFILTAMNHMYSIPMYFNVNKQAFIVLVTFMDEDTLRLNYKYGQFIPFSPLNSATGNYHPCYKGEVP